jgi:hypothetical protein
MLASSPAQRRQPFGKRVHTVLGVSPDDELAYAIADGHVLLTKAAAPESRRGL